MCHPRRRGILAKIAGVSPLTQVQPAMRDFTTAFPPQFLRALQQGVLAYTYKGISCMKCPIDLAIYTKLIWDLRPRSVVEIGTYKGGSALWLADTVCAAAIDSTILSIDLSPAAEFTDPRIEFLAGDAARLDATLDRKSVV